MGYIVGFSIIFLIISSNLFTNNVNHILATPLLKKVSFDEFDRHAIIPIKDKEGDFGIPQFTSNGSQTDDQKNAGLQSEDNKIKQCQWK
jgi:hypothetical protein